MGLLETISSTYHFGEFTLDVARGCVLRAGEEIKLRPKVYETLRYLVANRGRLIGKQELMQAVWPDSFVTDDSLVQCTVELRRALDDREQQLLKTVPRRGYIFTAEITQSTPNTAPYYDGDLLHSKAGRNLKSGIGKRRRSLVNLPTPALRSSAEKGKWRRPPSSCLDQMFGW